MQQLKIKRLTEWANRRFSYKIVIDGQEQFEIANGEEKIISTEQAHTIQAKLMWCGSKEVNLSSATQNIKEIRVKANNGPNVRFPLMAFSLIMIISITNLAFPENGAKELMTSLLVSVILYAIALLTVWRNHFLDIEVVTE